MADVTTTVPSNQTASPTDQGIANSNNWASTTSSTIAPSELICTEQEGADIYKSVAALMSYGDIETTLMSSGDSLKISCYFVYKGTMDKSDCIFLKYGMDVLSISIFDSVSEYGTSATAVIVDNYGNFSTILENQLDYYFVFSILQITKEETNAENNEIIEKGVLYQPHIFEIDSCKMVGNPGDISKTYQISLSDIISSTLKRVSYGNLLLYNPSFPNSQNFKEAYVSIINYALTIINLNHNKKYKVNQSIYLGSTIMDSVNVIIKDIVLKDITIDTSLYNVLNKIFNCAGTEIETPSTFSSIAENKGMVITPLMLMNEWEDVNATYRTYFCDHIEDDLGESFSYKSKNGNISGECVYFHRGFYLKGLHMPFDIAFFNKGEAKIYEIINPLKVSQNLLPYEEKIFNPMNGYTETLLDKTLEVSIDAGITALLWKNLALMNDSSGGGNNILVYFNWIYNYFKYVYLNAKENILSELFDKDVNPLVDPHFHKMESLNLMGGDNETFAKINARTIRMVSSDAVKETMYHVGKTLKSYVFLNSLFAFKTKGNIIRHPGEIIKLNNNMDSNEASSMASVPGGFWSNATGYVFGYITQVSHNFSGSEFNDTIYASKFCEILPKNITN